MEINKKSRRTLRIQGWIFTILFIAVIGLIGWLSTRYNHEFDWTATGRHTLTDASATVLEKFDGPINITSYASGTDQGPVRQRVRDVLKRYQKKTDKINLTFVDPMTNPEKTRELGIRVDGEMIIEYQGRTEHVIDFSERTITNTLQRLLRNAERQIIFVTGHGERNPVGQANHDLGILMEDLKNKGFEANVINLAKSLAVPQNTSVLVIASPQLNYLPGEITIIKDFLDKGGNLLWIHDPDSKARLEALATSLGIEFLDGVIVDQEIQYLGVADPTIIMGQYTDHTITSDFKVLTLFPRSAGLKTKPASNWQAETFLQSIQRSWLERGLLQGTIRFDEGVDIQGPVDVGVALSREIAEHKDAETAQNNQNKKTQRVVVIGDGDFISNAYLGNQGNQALGENILNWLTHDDSFIDIPQAKAPDAEMAVTETGMILFGALYFLVIPVMLVGTGVFIWFRRRKR